MDLKFLRINKVFDFLVMFFKLPIVVRSISEIVEFDICDLFPISKRIVFVSSVVLVSCFKVVVDSVVSSTTGTKVVYEFCTDISVSGTSS